MTRISASLVAALLAIAATAATSQDDEQPEQRTSPNPAAFLQQLVGEWSVVTYAVMDPEQEPYRFEGTENARMLGGQWLVTEYLSNVEGQTINSILTIGYDPAKEAFVATYVNSMQTQLWTYEGSLNDDGTTLTLNTEGPFMGDPNQLTDFRVRIECNDADHWTMRSQIQMPDTGEWFEFLRFEYERDEDEDDAETPAETQ